ncbi:MAG: hypothetical protein ACI9U2_001761 [Bradymonadia bacterium]|jgi:hypothetical protein
MSRRLIIAGFSGLLAGLLAGALDGIGRPATAALGGAGLLGLLGALFTMLATLCLPHRVVAAGEAASDEAIELHARCVQFARIWLLALGAPALLIALRAGFPILLARIQSPLFSAAATAALALISTGVVLAIAIAVGAATARGAEQLIRRRPALTRWLDVRTHTILAGAVLFTALAAGGLAMVIPVFLAGGAAVAGARWVRAAGPVAAIVLGVIALGACLAGGARLADAGPLARLGAQLLGLA